MKTKDVFDLMPEMKPIWNPVEELWIKHIEEFLAIKNDEFQALNDKVLDEMGESILQFCGRTGKYHLCKVIECIFTL